MQWDIDRVERDYPDVQRDEGTDDLTPGPREIVADAPAPVRDHPPARGTLGTALARIICR
jgi:hypothetical protein